MSERLASNLIQQFVRNADAEELRAWLDRLLPIVIERLPKEERIALVKSITQDYLSTLMRDFTAEERAALIKDLLPILLEEFSLQDINVLDLLG